MAGSPDVERILHEFRSLGDARELFSELGYHPANMAVPRALWQSRAAVDALAEDPRVIAQAGVFQIIYARLASDGLPLMPERAVITELLKEHPYALFLFSNTGGSRWHFVNVKHDPDRATRRILRRITVAPGERLRTAVERISKLDLEKQGITLDMFGGSALAIQVIHDKAFDVEAVTDEFFKQYREVFNRFQDDLLAQTGDREWAHDYALQFLNRLMFLYFVQRKGWLNEDTGFLNTLWRAYRKEGKLDTGTFFSEWLSVLFFEAFNKNFNYGHRHFPPPIYDAFAMAPWLNGGLFKRNELDRKDGFQVSDSRFEQIFAFYEGYNFTISEDTPLDQEVAVDPEMIGKVYESLVNVSDEADERGDAGIFYTPRVEIDLMCRLSLVDWLVNQLGEQYRSILYDAVFAFEPEEKQQADAALTDVDLWDQLNKLLRSVTVVDPACGSGSFLVGMLYVLDDLLMRAGDQLGQSETAYRRKLNIIGSSLYGVDVMDWAAHVAELRLWLQLVIDTEIGPEERRMSPLLPNLTFKIRYGDSLVQEVGGMSLARQQRGSLPKSLKGRIRSLQGEKLKYFNNDPDCKYKNADELHHVEVLIFRDVLNERLVSVRQQLSEHGYDQMQMFGEATDGGMASKRERLIAEQARLEEALRALQTNNVPFVWDIAFVEVFEGDRSGFDIVIGNPPYVRQEKIAPPKEREEQYTPAQWTQLKKEYKAKLMQAVELAYSEKVDIKKLDAKSDLYIYFYLLGLSLLNKQGVFCFITSNSWLDVGYGKDLQEFLLRRCRIHLILDNQVKRSFKSADVNTVICLFSAPNPEQNAGKNLAQHLARFVLFKVPFEQTLHAALFQDIDAATQRATTPQYRVFPISQATLLAEGMVQEEKGKTDYEGNKWGGKYLRAPDIYWTILEKGKGKLVRLGDIADVRRGFTTGANEFFYLDDAAIRKWGIEEEFLKPVIKSPRECKRILIDPHDLKYKIFMCNKSKADLKGTAAIRYIIAGEGHGFHRRPSCAGRPRWWDVGVRKPGLWAWPYIMRERIFAPYNPTRLAFFDNNLFDIYPKKASSAIGLFLNASIHNLQLELLARTYGGGGGPIKTQVYELTEMLALDDIGTTNFETAMLALSHQDAAPIAALLQNPARHTLDNIIFDVLYLTQGERDAVYEAVIDLVQARLSKADSLNRRQESADN